MNRSFLRVLASGFVIYSMVLVAPVSGLTLTNLTTMGATIADGNRACPGQSFFLYSGGYEDNFSAPTETAYPSPDLLTFMTTPPSVQGVINYDVPMLDGRFGDSFNLQNGRSVCYGIIRFRTNSISLASTDGFHIGHVASGGSPFNVAASVTNFPATTVYHNYALDATGLALLSSITGGATPLDSVLDVYLQDDTQIDFIKIFIWYGPNCREGNPPTC